MQLINNLLKINIKFFINMIEWEKQDLNGVRWHDELNRRNNEV